MSENEASKIEKHAKLENVKVSCLFSKHLWFDEIY
jgi:hypothetical protein